MFFFRHFDHQLEVARLFSYTDNTQVDQNGIDYDPKTDRKCGKNGAFTTVYSVNTVRFRPVIDRIIWRRNTYRIVSVW
jgi:hypothetical protein